VLHAKARRDVKCTCFLGAIYAGCPGRACLCDAVAAIYAAEIGRAKSERRFVRQHCMADSLHVVVDRTSSRWSLNCLLSALIMYSSLKEKEKRYSVITGSSSCNNSAKGCHSLATQMNDAWCTSFSRSHFFRLSILDVSWLAVVAVNLVCTHRSKSVVDVNARVSSFPTPRMNYSLEVCDFNLESSAKHHCSCCCEKLYLTSEPPLVSEQLWSSGSGLVKASKTLLMADQPSQLKTVQYS
jgi:hypothetical protein